jgi:hypothetical protein
MRSAVTVARALGSVVLTATLTVPPAAAHAQTTQFVPCSGTGGGAAGLAAAVGIANGGGGIIKLAPKCTYVFNASADGSNALPIITSNVIISGDHSIITRNPNALNFRIIQVGDGTTTGAGALTLIGTTVSGGTTSGTTNGGGILVLTNSELSLKFSRVTGNRANFGAGIHNFNNSMVKLYLSQVSDNHARSGGGGVWNEASTLWAFGSTIANNSAATNGGGLAVFSGVAQLIRSTVSGNRAAFGGGIFNATDGALQLDRFLIVGNHSTNNGGGIYNDGNAQINVSLVKRNAADVSALGNGGGIYNNGSTNLQRSAVVRNFPNNCSGTTQVPGCIG